MGVWVTLLRVTTAIVQCGMILSPGPDIINVYKNKTTGDLPALPLVVMIINNYLWTIYGYLTDSIFPLMATQLFGAIAAIVFTVVYYRWAVDRPAVNRLLAGGFVLCGIVTIYVVLGVTGVTNQNDDQVGTMVGYVALVANLWMYASPLGTIRHVIKSKSAASLPINISIMVLCNTVLWVALSIVDHDMIIMTVNITGFLLAITQITVYMRYRPNKTIVAQEEADKHISVIISPRSGVDGVKSPVYQPMVSPIEKTRV